VAFNPTRELSLDCRLGSSLGVAVGCAALLLASSCTSGSAGTISPVAGDGGTTYDTGTSSDSQGGMGESGTSLDTGGAGAESGTVDGGGMSAEGGQNCQFGTFSAPHAYPDACYQPYAANSVWNTPVSSSPSGNPSSATYLQYYTQTWPTLFFAPLPFGYTSESNDYYHPIYFSSASDPTYTVDCANTSCEPQGMAFHIPSYAQPAGGTDAHLGVIDQVSNIELDCWSTSPLSGHGGTLDAQVCSSGPVTGGTGLNGDTTAAGFFLWAGVIRQPEIVEGSINHALFMVFPCTSNTSVYPSQARTSDYACANGQGAPYGAYFRLNMTDAQISALHVPPYKQAIYTALAHYGAYVGDTNHGYGAAFSIESDQMYKTAGYTNPSCPTNGAPCTPLTAYFHQLGDPGWNGSNYTVDFGDFDWNTYGQFLNAP
jgi:hypothetical protein